MATVSPQIERRRFSVADYHRMAEAGILGERDRVELIDGEIINKSPIGFRHMAAVDRLTRLLTGALEAHAIVRVQGSVRLNDQSEPEPDFAILRPRPDFYATGPTTPGDVLWLIEVMDTSADYDRKIKLRVYARAGIAEVWLVDLNQDQVETYSRPLRGAFTEARIRYREQSVSSEAFPDLAFGVSDILG
jgi:Uma2 family endonuclease